MKRTYVEITCDGCGCASHYCPPWVDDQAEDDGWLIEGRKHYCEKDCKAKAERAAPANKKGRDEK